MFRLLTQRLSLHFFTISFTDPNAKATYFNVIGETISTEQIEDCIFLVISAQFFSWTPRRTPNSGVWSLLTKLDQNSNVLVKTSQRSNKTTSC